MYIDCRFIVELKVATWWVDKIPKCLDSFVQVYIHSVFICASTNDNAMFKLNWLIKV